MYFKLKKKEFEQSKKPEIFQPVNYNLTNSQRNHISFENKSTGGSNSQNSNNQNKD